MAKIMCGCSSFVMVCGNLAFFLQGTSVGCGKYNRSLLVL